MLHHHSHRIHISLLTEFSVAFDFDLQTLHYGVSFVVQRKHTVQLYQELRSFFGVEGDLKLSLDVTPRFVGVVCDEIHTGVSAALVNL